MDPGGEIKDLLVKNLEATTGALKILKKLHRDVWWRRVFGMAKFTVILGLLVFSYLKLEPILANLLNAYDKLLNPAGAQNVNKNLLDSFLNILK